MKKGMMYLGLVVLALLLGVVLVQYRDAQSSRQKLLSLQSQLQAETLEKAGWRETALRTKEVELPDLKQPLEQAKEAGSTPVVRTRLVTEPTPVRIEVPIPVECPPESGKILESHFDLASDLQLAIDITDDGKIFYTGKLFTHLSGPLFPEGKTVEQSLSASSEVAVSEVVRESLAYYRNRPPRFSLAPRRLSHWRVGLGFGIAVVPTQTGQVQIGPALYFGVQM